jgi:hypothetical protein
MRFYYISIFSMMFLGLIYLLGTGLLALFGFDREHDLVFRKLRGSCLSAGSRTGVCRAGGPCSDGITDERSIHFSWRVILGPYRNCGRGISANRSLRFGARLFICP